ncbi:MAG: hypothetical protein JWP77_435, partial [Polaromonas sp.]|nr:hypothetical protein [Polaromonas sp.]
MMTLRFFGRAGQKNHKKICRCRSPYSIRKSLIWAEPPPFPVEICTIRACARAALFAPCFYSTPSGESMKRILLFILT